MCVCEFLNFLYWGIHTLFASRQVWYLRGLKSEEAWFVCMHVSSYLLICLPVCSYAYVSVYMCTWIEDICLKEGACCVHCGT